MASFIEPWSSEEKLNPFTNMDNSPIWLFDIFDDLDISQH